MAASHCAPYTGAMGRTSSVALRCLFFSNLGFAQDAGYNDHDFIVGTGAAIPVVNTTNYFGTAPLLNFGYG
jgi:hypothetical protein